MAEREPGASLGRYQLERRIASGGMADVYLARQLGSYGFEKRVALKVLKQDVAGDDENVRMFIREALVTAEFRHPNLAQVYEVGSARGRLYIAMELIPGCSLAAMLRGLAERGKGMPMNVAVRIAIDALDGLAHAHEAADSQGKPLGLVHRDVSPQNIMVGIDGTVKIVDFGIARAELAFGKTLAPKIKGKFSYMAPEQWEPDASLDARADLFALGVVLYEMTTGGVRLFRGESPKDLYKAIVFDPIDDPKTKIAEYPDELAKIVMRSLERGRSARWPSARAMKIALLQFAQSAGWSITSKTVADTMRDALGSVDIESTWPLVDRETALALGASIGGDLEPQPSAAPAKGSLSVTVDAPGDTGSRARRNERHRCAGVSLEAAAFGALSVAAIAFAAGYLVRGATGSRSVGESRGAAAPVDAGATGPSADAAVPVAAEPPRVRVRGFNTLTSGSGAAAVRAAWQSAHPNVGLELTARGVQAAVEDVANARAEVAIVALEASVLANAANAAGAAGRDVFPLGDAVALVVVHSTHPRSIVDVALLRGWFGIAGAPHAEPLPTEPATMHPIARAGSNDVLAAAEAIVFGTATPAAPGMRIILDDTATLAAVASDPQSVSWVSVARAAEIPETVRVIGTDASIASAGTMTGPERAERLACASPLRARVNLVVASGASTASRAFVDWLRAPEQRALLRTAGVTWPCR